MGFGIRYFELDPDAVRQRLHALGARCNQPPHRVRKIALAGPQSGVWAGLRSDGEHHVLALMRGDQAAREVLVQDFEAAWQILEGLGLVTGGRQESLQEVWELHGIEFRLIEAAGLAPSLEINGPQEEHVRWAVIQLRLDPARARMSSAVSGPQATVTSGPQPVPHVQAPPPQAPAAPALPGVPVAPVAPGPGGPQPPAAGGGPATRAEAVPQPDAEPQALVTVPIPPREPAPAPAPEPEPEPDPTLLRQFVVAETGWTGEASEWVPGEHWIHWAVVLENPNTLYWCEFPTVQITVRDEQGRLLGQHEQVLTALPPGARIGWASALEITGNRPHTLEITPQPADWYPTESRPEDFPPFSYQAVEFEIREQEFEVTGEIVNPYPLHIEEVALVALFRDDRGALVSGEMTFVEGLPAHGTTPFKVEATVPAPYGPIASLDLLAVPWSSGDSNPWESALHR
ncbi:hypothetical protein [Actinocorallia populi]|uniref:hypothetical protein n=1 Tax=Actinocorallia populi TaxID=2079200 RepID=UPI000D088461|nr:hypothetical protein [Actinocorallia populi]